MERRTVSLSGRLKAAASLVRKGAVAADVGCDHGKLAAALILNGTCGKVYATDIRPLPLAAAEELIRSLGLSGSCELMLTDGLDGVPGDEVEDVVIAGLGADVTADIISRAGWLKDPDKQLILVPASKHERLRRYLAREGFRTLSEQAVSDKGHMYTVMLVRYTGEVRELTLPEAWLGKIDVNSGDGRKYLEAVTGRMKRITASVPDGDNSSLAVARAFIEYTEGSGIGT